MVYLSSRQRHVVKHLHYDGLLIDQPRTGHKVLKLILAYAVESHDLLFYQDRSAGAERQRDRVAGSCV